MRDYRPTRRLCRGPSKKLFMLSSSHGDSGRVQDVSLSHSMLQGDRSYLTCKTRTNSPLSVGHQTSQLSISDHEVTVIQSIDSESLVQAEARRHLETITITAIPAKVSMTLSARTV